MGLPSTHLIERPSAPVAGGNDDNYCIYASTAGHQPGPNIKILSTSSADTFVASLNKNQEIILSAAPNPTADFIDSDETIQWFKKLDPAASGSLTLDLTGDKNIESFLFSFSATWPLTFSSASDILIFTFGGQSQLIGGDRGGARIDPPGVDGAGQMLTCGLDFTQTNDISAKISDLFKFVGATAMLKYLPKGVPDLEAVLKRPTLQDTPQRNALWLVPGSDMQTTIRLQFKVPVFTALGDILKDSLKGFTVNETYAVCKKKSVLAQTEEGEQPVDQGEVAFSIECSVQAGTEGAPAVPMVAGVEFYPSGINLTLMFVSEDPLTGILKWLAWLIGDDSLESFVNNIQGKEENGNKLFSAFTLRRLTIGLDTLKDPKKPTLSSFAFDIEVSANFGRGSKSDPAVFLISYNWTSSTGGFGTLSGQLWNGE